MDSCAAKVYLSASDSLARVPFMKVFISPILISSLLLVVSLSVKAEDTTDWFRGNTHAHSLWSDGNDFAEMIIDFYHKNGYDFATLSDHDILAEGTKWVPLETIKKKQRAIGRGAIEKCEARFGKDWIERKTAQGKEGIVLKTLEQFRGKFEKAGEFHIMQSEEVSNQSKNGPIHINALNVQSRIAPVKNKELTAREVMREALGKINEQEKQTGVPILAHLNHPNFQWAVTPGDLAAVAEEDFFEVYNGHPGINHLGDETRPGDEEIWDIANTIRIAEMKATPLFGVATDDSHTYHGGDVRPGRGWIMVGAEKLDSSSIVKAMRAGDFYASSGVYLDTISYDKATKTLSIKIRPDGDAVFTTQFIGTRNGYDASAKKTGIGEVFATGKGNKVSFKIPEDALYLRATVTSSIKHHDASFEGQKKQAWIQPVGWR